MTQVPSAPGPANQSPHFAKTELWVQITTGGQPYPPSFQDMFLDPMFIGMEIWAIDQPASFAALLPPARPATTTPAAVPPPAAAPAAAPVPPGAPGPGAGALGGGTERLEPADYPWEPSGGRPHPGYDVLVLNDQTNFSESQRTDVRQALDAGRGLVVLHHALGDNQDWPWWYEEVTGGQFVLADRGAVRRSTTTRVASLAVTPAGRHPILRHIPLHLDQRAGLQGPVAIAEDHTGAPDVAARQRRHGGVGGRASDGAGGLHPTRRVARDPPPSGLPDASAQFDPLGRATADLNGNRNGRSACTNGPVQLAANRFKRVLARQFKWGARSTTPNERVAKRRQILAAVASPGGRKAAD